LQSFEYLSSKVKPLAINEQNSWLNQFIDQCNKQNVSVHSLQWDKPILQQGYEVSTLHLNIRGEYQALLQCINSIEQASIFSTISQFSLQVKDARLLQMQLDVQAYQLPREWKLARLNYLAPDFSIIQDPFFRELNLKNPANSIHSYALSQLKLLGNIQVNQSNYAIIAAPSGEIYHAKVGSSIGVEQAKLIKIQRRDVLLKTVSGRELSLRLAGN
ncbi:MAG: Pilus assembly protein PilP, partial [Gammaproteobacteria bacterium]|nr:Pilus assembly protein PilP [Gammaproteobacteria bacterium]